MAQTAPTDDEILTLAQEIKADKGCSLVEAMDIAAARLNKSASDIDCDFTLQITMKPKVAKFYRDSFSGHPTLSVEERLSEYVKRMLQVERGNALSRTREDMKVNDAEPVTVRRSAFMEQTGG